MTIHFVVVIVNQVTALRCGAKKSRDTNFSTMMTSLRSSLDLAKSPRSKIHVPVKETTLLFPPPSTCNNRAFNETKTSKPPKNGFDLKANVCITTSMSTLMMDETLKDLAYDLRDDFTMETDYSDNDTGANGTWEWKRTKTLLVKGEATHKKLQTFVTNKVDFCVYIVFQMAIDTYTKRQLYRAGDKEAANDVNDLFLNINLG